MSDFDYEDRPAEDPDELRREIRDRGARVAYEALIGVCLDPKAPAPAKATAGTTILRVGGYLEKTDDRRDGGPELSEERLEELIDGMKRESAVLERAREAAQAAGVKITAESSPERQPARKGKRKPPGGLFD
jgi:hypothetical protein